MQQHGRGIQSTPIPPNCAARRWIAPPHPTQSAHADTTSTPSIFLAQRTSAVSSSASRPRTIPFLPPAATEGTAPAPAGSLVRGTLWPSILTCNAPSRESRARPPLRGTRELCNTVRTCGARRLCRARWTWASRAEQCSARAGGIPPADAALLRLFRPHGPRVGVATVSCRARCAPGAAADCLLRTINYPCGHVPLRASGDKGSRTSSATDAICAAELETKQGREDFCSLILCHFFLVLFTPMQLRNRWIFFNGSLISSKNNTKRKQRGHFGKVNGNRKISHE